MPSLPEIKFAKNARKLKKTIEFHESPTLLGFVNLFQIFFDGLQERLKTWTDGLVFSLLSTDQNVQVLLFMSLVFGLIQSRIFFS